MFLKTMKQPFYKSVTLGFCETLEEKRARYVELGLSEQEINKLLLEVPENVKAGDKLFTTDDVTKFRQNERRKVEALYKGQQPLQQQTQQPVDNQQQQYQFNQDLQQQQQQPTQQLQTGVAQQTPSLSQEAVSKLVEESIAKALEAREQAHQQELKAIKDNLTSVQSAYDADKKKMFENRLQEIKAELPEDVHKLLTGDTLEALETSYTTIKGFVEKAKQEAQATVTASVQKEEHDKQVFYKAEDGTEYADINALVTNPAHLAEWKSKQN